MQMSRRRRPSPALIIAVIALFISLGGTGYAALKLPKNSVGSRELKKGAVTPTKVARATIRKFRSQRGPAGPKGDKGDPGSRGAIGAPGEKGATGEPGSAVAYAHVASDGTVSDAQNIAASSRNGMIGPYCMTTSVPVKNVVATVQYQGASPGATINFSLDANYISTLTGAGVCPAGTNVAGSIHNANGTSAEAGSFYIAFN
jgi:hypothetical protein